MDDSTSSDTEKTSVTSSTSGGSGVSSSDLASSASSTAGDPPSVGGGPSGPAGLPKLKEILRRQKPDSDDEDVPDVEFDYRDTDALTAEIAEFYSYTESPEFASAHKSFEQCLEGHGLCDKWKNMSATEKSAAVQIFLDQTELSSRTSRLDACRAVLYLAQGCWLENQNDADCLAAAKENVLLLHKHGVFATFVELLNLEVE